MKTFVYLFLGFGFGFNLSGILIPDMTYNVWGTVSLGLGIVCLIADDAINAIRMIIRNKRK